MGPNNHRLDRRVLATRFSMVTKTTRGDEKVTVTLVFRHAMPYAVTAIFALPGSSPVSWVFDRELLSDGLAGAAGIGDIRIRRQGTEFIVELYSVGHRATIEGPAQAALSFVREIFAAVPIGSEDAHFTFDEELKKLLANESPDGIGSGQDQDAGSHDVDLENAVKLSPNVTGTRPRKTRYRRD